MKVTVVGVEEKGFDGKDGRVLGAALTFTDPANGGAEKNLVGYGPQMAGVLKWQAGEQHEIEVFRPEGKDRDRFRLPREQGVGGGKNFQTSFKNTEAGMRLEQDGLDRRTAVMQAVAARHGIAGPLFDEGLANQIYAWLRAKA